MSTPAPSSRDNSIDLLRGLALVSIFINHIPENVAEPLTHKNFGLSDSAELFVLLAGVAAAFAYFARFKPGNRLMTSGRAVKRAGVLYVAHQASIVVGLAVFSLGSLWFARPELLQEINIAPFMEDPVRGVIGLAAMTHQLGYHNILPMYVVLLLSVPLVMLLAERGLTLLIGVSVALWVATQIWQLSLPNFPTEGYWFFNPFAWQIIFVAGFFVGVRMMRGQTPVPYVRPLWWAALAYLVAAGVYHKFNLYGSIPEVPFIPHHTQINEKPWVAIPRLAHILSLAYVVGHSPIIRWLRKVSPGNPLCVLGRQSLPVFWLGTVLAMVGQVFMKAAEPTAGEQIAYLAGGLAAQYGLALALDALATSAKRGRSRSAATAREPTSYPASVPAE